MVFTVLWRRQSKAAAILSPILGLATGIAVWLGTASHFGGEVSVASTGQVLPCMFGTVASCFSPIPYSIIITLLRPQRYDWADFRKEKLAIEKLDIDLTIAHGTEFPDRSEASRIENGDVNSAALESKELKRWGRIAAFWSIATFLGHWVIWPLPMYGSRYVFEKKVCARSSWFYTIVASEFRGFLELMLTLDPTVLHCLGCRCHHMALGHNAGRHLLPTLRRWHPADSSSLPWSD